MEKLNLNYLKPQKAKSYNFYQIPKLIIEHSVFKDLDGWAIILYGLMLNRAALSMENEKDFTDENGNVYIIFTIEEVMEKCHCSNKTAVGLIKQLENIGLLKRKRQGLGKPSITYVMDFSSFTENQEV